MDATDSPPDDRRIAWIESSSVAFFVALAVVAAAFWIGMPYPLAKANSLVLWWGIAAAATIIALAFSRATYPWSNALASLSIYSVLNAGFALFIRETRYFQARLSYDAGFQITGLEVGTSWPDFLVGVLPAALLAICWALTIELWFPRRGAATTGILIAACATLIGAAALDA